MLTNLPELYNNISSQKTDSTSQMTSVSNAIFLMKAPNIQWFSL